MTTTCAQRGCRNYAYTLTKPASRYCMQHMPQAEFDARRPSLTEEIVIHLDSHEAYEEMRKAGDAWEERANEERERREGGR